MLCCGVVVACSFEDMTTSNRNGSFVMPAIQKWSFGKELEHLCVIKGYSKFYTLFNHSTMAIFYTYWHLYMCLLDQEFGFNGWDKRCSFFSFNWFHVFWGLSLSFILTGYCGDQSAGAWHRSPVGDGAQRCWPCVTEAAPGGTDL